MSEDGSFPTLAEQADPQPKVKKPIFKGLSPYGSYGGFENAYPVPKKGVIRIPKDGSIKLVKKLGIPFAEIVDVVNSYGKHWFPEVCGYVIPSRFQRRLLKAQTEKVTKAMRPVKPCQDIIMCIREASRAAHRERDAAQEAYQARQHKLAGNSKRRKEHWYTLKDNGIAHEYMAGNLRYAGKTAQGLAVYEFGDGGMNCFHSTLHPAGMEQVLIPDHPEIIEVAAKDKVKGISLKRIEATLAVFSLDPTAFVRSCSPAKPRTLRTIICYTCGGEGHIARQCGNSD